MISSTQLRPGMVIKFNNELYSIFKTEHRTPGNLRGFVQASMRRLANGAMTEHRFSSEDKVERAIIDEQRDGVPLRRRRRLPLHEHRELRADAPEWEMLGDAVNYLIPQFKVVVVYYEDKPISVDLPPSVDMVIVETEPGLKGATVSNVTKPATLETGLVVQVPPFISSGEKIRVNTSDGSYLERA